MHEILKAGIDLIVAIQGPDLPALQRFFEVFTDFGGRHYLYLVPLLVWCVDYRLGLRVCAAMAATLFVNTTVKEWIAQPRPFEMDARVVSAGEAGYGLPSGHAQLVVLYWGLWADWMDRRSAWALACVVMGLMGFSRVYLGVHFPSDVIAGFTLGGLTLFAIVRWQGAWAARASRLASGRIVVATAVGTVVCFAFDWLAVRDAERLNPGALGFLAGTALGALWLLRRGGFDVSGPIWKRALRYVVGMFGALLLVGLMRGLGLPSHAAAGRAVVTLDLGLFALWITAIAPMLFERIGLAVPAKRSSPERIDAR